MKMLPVMAMALSIGAITPAKAEGINDARSENIGTQVTVEGYVTVPSGKFTGSSFDQGFAIQDSAAGIYVSVASNPALTLNQRVIVTGTLSSSFNQLMLSADAADVQTLGGAKHIKPTAFNTGDINNHSEGLLVNVKGTVTSNPIDDLPYGWKFNMDDGSGEITIFIPSTVNLNPFNVPWLVPGQTVSLSGLSSEFDDHFEINPRHRGDLVKIGAGE